MGGASTQFPTSNGSWQAYKVFSNVEGLIVPSIATPIGGQFRAAGPLASVLSNIAVTTVTAGFYTTPAPIAQSYTFGVDPATDLGAVAVGDVLVIEILAGPYTGTYRYTISAVDNGNKTVTVFIPAQTFTTLAPLNPAFPGTAYVNLLVNLKLDIEPRTSTTVAGILDENLHDGEIVLVPVAPLQNSTQYQVTFQMVTPSYNSGAQTFTFTTNANGIYDPN